MLLVNTTCIDKLKLVIIYKFLRQDALEGGCQQIMCGGFANHTTWMTSTVFKSCMMSLNVHFKSQKRKVLVITDNYATHSLMYVGRGESFGYSTLRFDNITMAFLRPNVTSVVQPLDQGNSASFNLV